MHFFFLKHLAMATCRRFCFIRKHIVHCLPLSSKKFKQHRISSCSSEISAYLVNLQAAPVYINTYITLCLVIRMACHWVCVFLLQREIHKPLDLADGSTILLNSENKHNNNNNICILQMYKQVRRIRGHTAIWALGWLAGCTYHCRFN